MAADFHATPTELGLIYWPKSTNRSRLTALSIRRCADRLFKKATLFQFFTRVPSEENAAVALRKPSITTK